MDEHFKLTKVQLYLHLSPKFINNIQIGIDEQLNSYKEELEGVVLCYKKCKIVQDNALIINENPLLHFHVNVEFLVFCASKGGSLRGTVTKQNADHLGLLVLGLFNAAVSKEELERAYRWNKQVRCWEHKRTKKMLETGSSELLLKVKNTLFANDAFGIEAALEETSPEASRLEETPAALPSQTRSKKKKIKLSAS